MTSGDRDQSSSTVPSYFDQFDNFKPDNDAPFEHEFALLASSQNWVPGSQVYTKERTVAIRQELNKHYFSQSQTQDHGDGELTEEEKLEGYQSLCREVRITPSDSIAECKKDLKNTLVNIVDLIDARRTRKEVKIWNDFEAFREYTLQDEHRINMEEARKDGGYLASLLQKLRGPRLPRRRGRRAGGDNGSGSGSSRVASGRVKKKGRS